MTENLASGKGGQAGHSPVEVLLHHLGRRPGDGPFLRPQVLVQVHSKLLLQKVNYEFCARNLFMIIFNPRHFPLSREFSTKIILSRGKFKKRKAMFYLNFTVWLTETNISTVYWIVTIRLKWMYSAYKILKRINGYSWGKKHTHKIYCTWRYYFSPINFIMGSSLLLREPKENKAYIHAKVCAQMFIEALFATVKHRGKNKSSSRGKWISKSWYNLTIKRNELQIYTLTWVNLKITLLSERSQTKKKRIPFDKTLENLHWSIVTES